MWPESTDALTSCCQHDMDDQILELRLHDYAIVVNAQILVLEAYALESISS